MERRDGKVFHLLESEPCLIQRLRGAVISVGRFVGLRFILHQRNLRTHDATGLDPYGILHGDGERNLLHLMDTHLDVGPLAGGL